ncbi:MAG: transposase [Candidatus Eisenbacteria sp.]|nr:transposase [Candidatus Eisenbacteria bacterium]
MSRERFQSTGKTSFYGDYLYDRIVPQDDFLRKLKEVVPWQRFTYKLVKYYKGKARTGRPPIEPSLVLRMLLLSYLYNLSECDVERYCQENLPAKYFLGLAIDAPVPDHSTLTVFKNRTVGGEREAQGLHQAPQRHHPDRSGKRRGLWFAADTDTELYVSSTAPIAWPT